MIERRVALVSGANRGIGLEVVRQLAKLGMTAVLGSRDRKKGAAAEARLVSEGIEAPLVALDVTDAKQRRVRGGARARALRSHRRARQQCRHRPRRQPVAGVERARGEPRDRRAHARCQHAGPSAPDPSGGAADAGPGLRPHRQRVVRARADLGHGRQLARLSHVEGGAQCADPHRRGRGRLRQHQGQRHEPRLGAHRHGRPRARRARWPRAPTPSSGWQRCPTMAPPASSSRIASRSPGEDHKTCSPEGTCPCWPQAMA